jgi:tripartite-type tricarboxylate transporter receptor subunit TctC
MVTRSFREAGLALAIATGWMPAMSSAQEWPSKPVRFIMPFVAGGSSDASARVLAERLAAKWKQPVVVENRPGAGTIIGTDTVAKAQPDGYTVGWVITAHAVNPSLYARLPYDTTRDLAGVTPVYQLKSAIVASPSLPVSTVDDLIRLVRSKPGQMSYASPGTGSGVHLVAELFKLKHGLDIQHVAYKGGNAGQPDVMSGRVPLMFQPLPGALPMIEARKLKLIAVISDAPIPGHPEFPLLTGLLPKDAAVGWNGIVVPAGTPRAIVARLNADFVAVIRSPEVQERFAALTVQTLTSTPEKFDALIREDIVRWADVIKRAGIKLE